MVNKEADGSLSLSWGNSCNLTDTDFAVYEGPLGAFSQQTPIVCSTGGLTNTSFEPDGGSTFFLVVAHDGGYEGSYGVDSEGNPRVSGPVQCLPTAGTLGCE